MRVAENPHTSGSDWPRAVRAGRDCRRVVFCVLIAAALLAGLPARVQSACPPTESRPAARGDGIGRFYLGREIAHVMGHQVADWLDRPEREREERPTLLMRSLGVRPTDVVADIGAGSGYFTIALARLAPKGQVYAVDIQPPMLVLIRQRMQDAGIANVVPVLGAEADAGLPAESVDLALLVDVYHEFSQPCEMMRSIVRALKVDGRVALVEYRAEDASVPIRPSHKMTRDQVRREMAIVGLELVPDPDSPPLPRQHLMFFRRMR